MAQTPGMSRVKCTLQAEACTRPVLGYPWPPRELVLCGLDLYCRSWCGLVTWKLDGRGRLERRFAVHPAIQHRRVGSVLRSWRRRCEWSELRSRPLTVAQGSIAQSSAAILPVGQALHGAPLPTSMYGAKVSINGIQAPLFFVSPGQINAQIRGRLEMLASLVCR